MRYVIVSMTVGVLMILLAGASLAGTVPAIPALIGIMIGFIVLVLMWYKISQL